MTRYALLLSVTLAALVCIRAAPGAAGAGRAVTCPRAVTGMVVRLDAVERAVEGRRRISRAHYRALVDAVAIPLPFGLSAACEVDVFTPAASAEFAYLRAILAPERERRLWALAAQELGAANGVLRRN